MNDIGNIETTGGEKKGNWIKRNLASLLILIFVTTITVFLFVYRDSISDLGNYGYLGSFLVSLATNATIILPMPGLIMLLPLGAAFNPVLIGLAAGIGGVMGEMTGYLLGYSGRRIWGNNKAYQDAVGWLKKWGSIVVFIFTVTPLPMDVMGMAAGNLRFPLWKFFIACWIGKTVLYICIALTGAWGWDLFVRGQILTTPAAVIVIAAVAATVLVGLALFLERWTWKRGR